jgi:CheY-like chemotaxis protein
MKKELKCIMLVDDDIHDNFFNIRAINKAKPSVTIIEKNSGPDALEYLKSDKPRPDLIFLDINMPIMDGWAFLGECSRLDEELLKGVMIMMLTSSKNPTDELRANAWALVSGFVNKPLTKEIMEDIISKLFTK